MSFVPTTNTHTKRAKKREHLAAGGRATPLIAVIVVPSPVYRSIRVGFPPN